MKRLIILCTLLIALSASIFPAHAQDEERQSLDFVLTFVPNVQFAPIYLMDRILDEQGIDLNIQYMDENVGVDLIANGNVPFGMIGGEQVILARAAERPIVYVYEWFQKFPVGIIVPDTTDAQSVTDLAGMKVGVPGRFGASYSGLTAILNANDLSESDIQLEAIGFAAPDVVCVGGVDASVVYINNEPLQIQQRADAGECGDITRVTVFPVSDYVDMVSNGLVTSEALIAENPELVQTIVTAFDAGLRQAILNPAQAYLDIQPYVENLPLSAEFEAYLRDAAESQAAFLATNPAPEDIVMTRAVLEIQVPAEFPPEEIMQFLIFLNTIKLWEADQLGVTDPASWDTTLALLESMGSLVAPLSDISAAYTNDFLPTMSDEN